MKIALISPLPPPSGGIARWTERYLAWFKGKAEVLIVNTALVGKRAASAGARMRVFDELLRVCRIIRETRTKLKDKPDLVHLNTSCSKTGIIRDWVCARMAAKRRVPVVVQCHCNIEDQLGDSSIAVWMFRKITAIAAVVLVLNEKSRSYAEQYAPGRVIVCPNFIMTDQIVDSHSIRDEIRTIIYAGDVRRSKGSDDLFRLAEQFPEKKFVLAGAVAEEMKTLKKPENVTLLGRLEAEDVYRQMDQADVFLFPSLTEGFSNALLEAMAHGLPVIATDVGANADMIEDQGGIIAAVHDVKAMRDAVDYLESRNVRTRMSSWNIAKTSEHYTQDAVLGKLVEIYSAVLSQNG